MAALDSISQDLHNKGIQAAKELATELEAAVVLALQETQGLLLPQEILVATAVMDIHGRITG